MDGACELYHCVTLTPGDSGRGVRVVSLCDTGKQCDEAILTMFTN